MRVAWNLLAFGARAGGMGRYARELAPAVLAERPDLEVHLFLASDAPAWATELAAHPRVTATRLRVATGDPLRRYPAQLLALGHLADRAGCDLVHGAANFVPLTGPLPAVAMVHDVMWIEHAELSGFTPFEARVWRALTWASTRVAQRVLVNSETTARDVERLLGVPRERLDVAPLGTTVAGGATAPAEAEIRTRHGLCGCRVVLSVGQKRPHKNVETIIRALVRLPEDVVLVAPGADDGHGAVLAAVADELGVADRVRLPAWVDDAELEGLYRLADVDVQMSLLEGFGLPALEAMGREVPTIVSTAPALVEAVGDCAVIVPLRDDAGLAAAIARVLDEPGHAADLVTRGRRRCSELTWARTARGTLASWDRALAVQ